MIDIHPDIRKFWESAGYKIQASTYGGDYVWWDLYQPAEDLDWLQTPIGFAHPLGMRWGNSKRNIAFFNGSPKRMGYRFPDTALLYGEKRMLRLLKMKAFI